MVKNLSWLILAVVIWFPTTFFITYIMAWQLNHIDPFLPFISETAAERPESCVFAFLVNYGAVLFAVGVFARYEQVQQTTRVAQSVLAGRANKAAIIAGLASAVGMTMVANFQLSAITMVDVMHVIGAVLTFGVGTMYAWFHTALSFVTRKELSTLLVCCLRVLFSSVSTASIIFITFIYVSQLNYTQSWRWASAGCQWTSMMSLIFYFLTYFGEFRRITLRILVVDCRSSSDSDVNDKQNGRLRPRTCSNSEAKAVELLCHLPAESE